MSNPVTVLAPIKLVDGKSEKDLIEASNKFDKEFASLQPGILRRELIRTGNGEYMDIVQFRSKQDAEDVFEQEKESEACLQFFSIMDMSNESSAEEGMALYESLVTYG